MQGRRQDFSGGGGGGGSQEHRNKGAHVASRGVRLSVPLYDSRLPDRFSKIAHALDPG